MSDLKKAKKIKSKLEEILNNHKTKQGETDVNIRDNNMNGRLLFVFMILLFGGFIWLMMKYGWTGRGEAASVHGKGYDWLLSLNFIIIIAVFFLTNFSSKRYHFQSLTLDENLGIRML